MDPLMSPGSLETLLGRTYAETAVPDMRTDDVQYMDTMRALILELHGRGNAVIVGRGAQAILDHDDDTVHVRVACDQDERIRRIAERDGMAIDDAAARVRDSDSQREAWHRKYFDIDYRSPYLYHLVVNSGRLSDAAAAEIVTTLVRLKAPLPG
jgi:cytidylate kinase